MKRRLKIYLLRITGVLFILFATLLAVVLNPGVLYAHSTPVSHFTVYHQSPIDPNVSLVLHHAECLIRESEIYDSTFGLDLCLNDGSYYPGLIRTLGGAAFARGFYNKVVLMSHADFHANVAELNGWKWNLEQLLAHEMVHCLQYHQLGFWKSGPFSSYALWKWEGYPEYIARRKPDQVDLRENIQRKLNSVQADPAAWAIAFSDSTISPREYYDHWLLVQYCMDVKEMSFDELMSDATPEQELERQMMHWFENP